MKVIILSFVMSFMASTSFSANLDEKSKFQNELETVSTMLQEIGVNGKHYCCRGPNGPSMKCSTSSESRCSRKKDCYWNC
jgi:hypothetical protein